MHRRYKMRGFTLIELLVGVAIFSMLMAAIGTLFMSSLRTSRTTEAKVDISGMASGALTIMERDLSGAFTSRDFGEYYQFCGTPYGFTMVGVAPGGGLQRTTWVVTDPYWLIPGVASHEVVTAQESPTDGAQIKAYTWVLLRFTETDFEDLDSFYFYWDSGTGERIPTTWEQVASNPEGAKAGDRFDALAYFFAAGLAEYYDPEQYRVYTAAEQSGMYSALKRELWIEMLRGAYRPDPSSTDKPPALLPAYPQFWADVNADGTKAAGDPRPDFRDYVVAEMVANPDATGDEALVTRTDGSCFLFAHLLADASSQKLLTRFWSTVYDVAGYRSFYEDPLGAGEVYLADPGYDGLLGDPLQPRLPDAVQVNLTFLMEGPMVNSPDIWHRTKQMIDVPTAYTRSVP